MLFLFLWLSLLATLAVSWINRGGHQRWPSYIAVSEAMEIPYKMLILNSAMIATLSFSMYPTYPTCVVCTHSLGSSPSGTELCIACVHS